MPKLKLKKKPYEEEMDAEEQGGVEDEMKLEQGAKTPEYIPMSQKMKLIPNRGGVSSDEDKSPYGKTTYRKSPGEAEMNIQDARMFTGEAMKEGMAKQRLKRELMIKKKLKGM